MRKRVSCFLLTIALFLGLCLPALAAETYIHGYFRYTVEDQSVTIIAYTGREAEVTVPNMIAGNPVNTIAAGAFSENPYVKTVYLPDTVTEIQEGAFAPGQTTVMNSSQTEEPEPDPSPSPIPEEVDPDVQEWEVGDEPGGDIPTPPQPTSEPSPQPSPQPVTFTDVPEGKWYAAAVSYVAAQGVMNGNGDGTFSPDRRLNRAMLVQILYNLEDRPNVSGSAPFSDVPEGKWYADAVAWASACGLVQGYEDGTYAPERDITREQMVTILWRYARYKGEDVSASGSLSGFSDADRVSSYALDALLWAVARGVVRGNDDGTLDPRGTATRAQVAQIMMNYLREP